MNKKYSPFLGQSAWSGWSGLRWLPIGSLLARGAPGVGRLQSGCRDLAPSPAISGRFLAGLLLLCALGLPGRALGVGTWTLLANQPAQGAYPGIGLCLLLSDGTVLAEEGDLNAIGPHWYQLTPDSRGH